MEKSDIDLFSEIVCKAIEPLNERFDSLEGRFDKLEKKVDHLDLEVREIKLTIDNEIKPQISFIAEGHLNLNRKLDEYIDHVLKVEQEHEQMNLRLAHQESELIKIKDRLDASTQTA